MREQKMLKTTGDAGGLVVITEKLPHVRSVALGLAYALGSRDDPEGQEGMCHLIEHMVFKGTETMSGKDISIAAESHGAELNAFTDRETTCFYGRFPSDQCEPVTRLLAEIVSRPGFNQAELEKEKEVIGEEIRATEEDPEAQAVNLLFRVVYGEQPMGRPVAGSCESVGRIGRSHLLDFFRTHYGRECGVVVAAGDIEHEQMVELLTPVLTNNRGCRLPGREQVEIRPPASAVQSRQDISQVHVCLARPAFPYRDPRRQALLVLNMLVGGGVSSRLFQRLREDEGLVYSVSSFVELYQDSGLVGVYFVADRRKLGRCADVVTEELRRLRQDGIGQDEFERAVNMTRSSVLLALENTTNRMLRLARTYQLLGEVVDVDETLIGFSRLKREDVVSLVEELLPAEGFHAGAVGPLSAAEFCREAGLAGPEFPVDR